MTTRTYMHLICECGQTGLHVHSENDQPYSKEWNPYRLDGFSGGGPERADLAKMVCHRCGQTGKVKCAD